MDKKNLEVLAEWKKRVLFQSITDLKVSNISLADLLEIAVMDTSLELYHALVSNPEPESTKSLEMYATVSSWARSHLERQIKDLLVGSKLEELRTFINQDNSQNTNFYNKKKSLMYSVLSQISLMELSLDALEFISQYVMEEPTVLIGNDYLLFTAPQSLFLEVEKYYCNDTIDDTISKKAAPLIKLAVEIYEKDSLWDDGRKAKEVILKIFSTALAKKDTRVVIELLKADIPISTENKALLKEKFSNDLDVQKAWSDHYKREWLSIAKTAGYCLLAVVGISAMIGLYVKYGDDLSNKISSAGNKIQSLFFSPDSTPVAKSGNYTTR